MNFEKQITTLLFLCFSLVVFGQTDTARFLHGEQYARQELKKALDDTTHQKVVNAKSTKLDSKEQAIKFAETILFNKYGKKTILNEKPYEVYRIDSYWVMTGTLPKGWEGGTFLIILNSTDGRVLKLIHGQ